MLTTALLPRRRRSTRVWIGTVAALLVAASVRPAHAQTAAELYARTQADQQQLNATATVDAARRG